ncbi:galactonate dehydratase [Nonomuraea sp. NPDC050451]|uniref:galactonate dehydratase n=1 Tax=Nonomuraea sp. NPDC050451 TaxID=3364364 RepID=UPI0037A46279
MTRIVGVDTVVVNARLRNWVFVRVTTDQPGLIGWGESTLEWKTRAVVGAVDDLAPLLHGQDPHRVEHLWQLMHRGHFFRGGAVTMSAIAGIDQALWDIKAKELGVPCWQLFGGAVRSRLRMYDHLGGGDSAVVYGPAEAGRFAEAAQKSVADGFTAVKILAVPMGGALPAAADLRAAAAAMGAVRAEVGADVDIMVDLHGRTTAAGALAYGHALAEYRPYFFEEPCQPGNPGTMADLARRLPFPVATGERLIGLQEFREHLAAGACAVLQPDVCHVGGPTALRKIAALAETWQVPLAPHNPLGPVATMVNQHVGFSTPNFLIQEVMRADVPWRDDVAHGTLPITHGHVELPERPGWGIDIDEAQARRHPYVPEPALDLIRPDGSLTDW